ncbi:DUF397 domain-containing protein [Paractinoplanes durhamensis]|uniref:DUF397 domain-containing protein n=1 Tax=Paractinoplanes durhamensis TaxID=113563 RepID=A0ABQ3Z1B6_9ACTN|nr:DUF397 domain-containing protein [Actinoplanes durhamensis]GIE03623.1 DUF397 domain-containing protein [Actinoplanes durhamensis]
MIKLTENLRWRRSSRCASNTCVEIATVGQTYLVRDAKDPNGAVLSVDAAGWAAFVSAVKTGEFDA